MSTTVVFLARGVDAGLAAARAFFESYRANSAGLAHELIVIAKGWESLPDRPEMESMARELGARVVDLPDDGFDWGAYMRIAPQLNTEWVCFLNSHSRIQSDGWLAKLHAAASRPGVGAAGATGLWGSMRPMLRLVPQGVADVYRNRGLLKASITAIAFTIRFPAQWLYRAKNFRTFPNPYIRSNAFFMRRNLFLQFISRRSPPQTKWAAWELESGRRGLPTFVTSQKLKVVVVGSDGRSFEVPDWKRSQCFWVPTQPNLLIRDNQTLYYEAADDRRKRTLEVMAWGRPALDQLALKDLSSS